MPKTMRGLDFAQVSQLSSKAVGSERDPSKKCCDVALRACGPRRDHPKAGKRCDQRAKPGSRIFPSVSGTNKPNKRHLRLDSTCCHLDILPKAAKALVY